MTQNSKKIIVFVVVLALAGLTLLHYSVVQKKQVKLEAEQLAQKEAERKALEEIEKIYLLGKFEPSQREYFVRVPEEYNMTGYTTYLRQETLSAFLQMAAAAEKEGVDLQIVSAVRNFDSQKKIWDDKWNGTTLVDGEKLNLSIPDGLERFKKILEYSSVPSTSRHHWGTDIDINMTVPYYFQTEAGRKVYEWLTKNASTYGFCQTYTAQGQDRSTGYNEEKWHWSYLPLAKDFTERYKTLITDADIKGFAGDENVANMNLIHDYVLGINPACL